jgi:hypothetical protein
VSLEELPRGDRLPACAAAYSTSDRPDACRHGRFQPDQRSGQPGPSPEVKNENGPADRFGRARVLYSLFGVNQSRGRTAPVNPL